MLLQIFYHLTDINPFIRIVDEWILSMKSNSKKFTKGGEEK